MTSIDTYLHVQPSQGHQNTSVPELLAHPSQLGQGTEQATKGMISLVESLDWLINQKKSELQPTQVFDFVSYRYVLSEALVWPTQERRSKLQSVI